MKIGDVSLLAGLATGKGMLGKAMRQGFGGMIPQAIAKGAYEDEMEKQRLAQAMPMPAPISATGMKKGGMTASARADGIAQRGKTRGKMV